MTPESQSRLAQIRAQQAKWEAIDPEWAETFDNAFLLKVIDELLEKRLREIR